MRGRKVTFKMTEPHDDNSENFAYVVRAERARRTLETLYTLKRKTPADAKKGRK